jgi:hypothetical protein
MKYLLTLSVAAITLFSACNDNDCVRGGGTLNDYTLTVNDFSKIAVAGPINIEITQGSTQNAMIRAEPEVFGIMETKVQDGELIIDFENGSCIKSSKAITLFVTTDNLSKITVSGTSIITSTNNLELNSLTIKVAGTADVNLTGGATTQKFNVAGDIDVENFGFVTENTIIDISGSGGLEISCTKNLDIKVSGAATVKYKGLPTIKQNVSGSISLIESN